MGVGDDAAAREAAGLFIVHERLGNADAATTYALHGVGSSSSNNSSNNSRNNNSNSSGNGYGGINSSNSSGNSTGAVEQQALRVQQQQRQQQQQQQQEPQRLVPVAALRQSFFADLDASSRVNPLRKVTDNKTHGRTAAAGGGSGAYAHGRGDIGDKDDEETSMSNSGSAATSRCNNGDVAATLGTRTLLSCVTSMFVSNSSNNSSSSSSYDLQRRVVDVLLPIPPPSSSSQPTSLPCLAQPAGVVGMPGVSTGYGDGGYAPARESLLSCALRDGHGLLVTASLGVCAGVAGKRVARGVLAGVLSGVAVVNVLCVAGYAQVRWADLLRDAAALVRHPPRLCVPSSNGNNGGNMCGNDVGNAVASEAVGLLRRARAIVTASTLRRVTFGVAVACGILC